MMMKSQKETSYQGEARAPLCSATVGIAMGSPEALYLHVPFCGRICPYCAFNVTSRFDPAGLDRFIDTAVAELAGLDGGNRLLLKTVYVGGGTPTELDATRLGRLLEAIRERCDPKAIVEWTVEANPDTVDEE